MTFADKFEDYGIKGVDYSKSGEQYVLCPQCSPHRKQGNQNKKVLGVRAQEGLWGCNHCGWGGHLKTSATAEKKPTLTNYKPIDYKASEPNENIIKFFKSRGISPAVLLRNKIHKAKMFFSETNKEEACIAFPFYYGEDIVNVKYRTANKLFRQEKNALKIFYKINDIIGSETMIITEGEIDALSYEEVGFRYCVSVPDGAINANAINVEKKMEFFENSYELLKNIKTVYLATDADSPGVRLRDELARRFGKSKCFIVTYPEGCKDANEVLTRHGRGALIKTIEDARPYPLEGIQYANSRKEQLDSLYADGYPNGAKTGWSQFDKHLRFYDSVFTVVTGIPSHGKSNFVDHLIIRLAVRHGWKAAIFSPENAKLEWHLQRLCEIVIGKPFLPGYEYRMSVEEKDAAMEFINNHFYFIQPSNEEYTMDNILDSTSQLVQRYGVKLLILDPWNMIEHDYKGTSETDYTKKALNQLIYFTREHALHTIVVAHPAKMRKMAESKKYDIPTLYDISGSAHWYNKAEIGITVYRQYSEDLSETKATLIMFQKVKHRHFGRTGMVKYDFNPSCQRFVERDSIDGANYLETTNNEYPNNWDDVDDNEVKF
jgi:twinkle protein